MRPAPAIGVTLDGERPEEHESPHRIWVEHGEVRLTCRWPSSPSALRGAVVAACGGAGVAHVDLHNHMPDGGNRQVRATVSYRLCDDEPRVWAYGPRAIEHLQQVARLGALRLPAGEVVAIEEARLRTSRTEVGIAKVPIWHRYTLASTYFPPDRLAGLRMGARGTALDAWAGSALAGSIRGWLADLGIEGLTRIPHVHLLECHHEPVRWRYEESRHNKMGFRAAFLCNVALPDGVGLGQHTSEGYGEVRCA